MCIKGRAPPWVYGLIKAKRPVGAKALIIKLLPLQGALFLVAFYLRAFLLRQAAEPSGPGLCASAPSGRAA